MNSKLKNQHQPATNHCLPAVIPGADQGLPTPEEGVGGGMGSVSFACAASHWRTLIRAASKILL